jgi:hypothetical protein
MGSSRVVVVVSRREPGLHEYLRRAMAGLEDVEVVLDRRATSATPAHERRRRPADIRERKLLLCSLVHCPAPAGPSPGAGTGQADGGGCNGAHHRLLRRALRLDDL